MQVAPRVYYDAYQENEIAADRAYKGRVISMRSPIAAIEKDMFGGPTGRFGDVLEHINLSFERAESSKLELLKRGQTVTVVCRGAGMTIGTPMLADCVLVEPRL